MASAPEAKIDAAKAEAAAEQAYAAAAAAVEVKTPAKKAVPAKKVAAPKKAVATVKKTAAKKAVKKVAAPKTAAKKPAIKVKSAPKTKETIMAKTKTAAEDLTSKVKKAFTEAQDRAKTAIDKGQDYANEYGEFTKGNVDALVESGKILVAGLKDLTKDYAAEGRSAFETMTADVKELAAVKSPADFFKLQGEMLRRNFDAAVTSGSKHSESLVKLANDVMAPIQDRVSMAIDKVKKAA